MKIIRPHGWIVKKGQRVRPAGYSKINPQAWGKRQHDAHVKAWQEYKFLQEYKAKWGRPWPGSE